VRHFSVYTNLGQSEKTGDERRSLNQMYGVTWSEIGHTGLRATRNFSKFDSSFAQGQLSSPVPVSPARGSRPVGRASGQPILRLALHGQQPGTVL